LIDFQKVFTARLRKQFATKCILHISSHLKDVAALLSKTVMFQKSQKNSQI